MSLLSPFTEGLMQVLSFPAILLLLAGVVVGSIAGPLPGIGGPLVLILLMPFALQMGDPFSAFALLLAAHSVMTTGDSLTSILFGVPGENAAQALLMDGYPLAQKGEAGRALGASFLSAGIGGLFGAVCLVIAVPLVIPMVRFFGSPELFILVIWGLSMVALLSARSPLKGFTAAAFGLFLATVGLDPQRAIPRFDFGQTYLWDGLPLVSVSLGLFAAPEVIEIISQKTFLKGNRDVRITYGQVGAGMLDCLRHWRLVLRNSSLGVFLGIIPGIGGSVIDWLAYGYTVQTSADRETFGSGDIRGVIGPDSASNSKEGGALIPTVAFGVPGSVGMAILLGVFISLGVSPGTSMLSANLPLTFGFAWILVIANLIAMIGFLLVAPYLARVTLMRPSILSVLIIFFTIFGSFMVTRDVFDLVILLVFSCIGFLMKLYDWPRAPVILGFVIGGILERYLFISLNTFGPSGLLRPGVILLVLLMVLSYLLIPKSKPRTGLKLPGQEV